MFTAYELCLSEPDKRGMFEKLCLQARLELTCSRGVTNAHVEHDLFHVVLRQGPEISACNKGENAEVNSRRGSTVLTHPCVCWKVTQTGAFKRKDVHLGSRFWRLVTPEQRGSIW